MLDQKRNSVPATADADPETAERIGRLERALAEYVERYGLTELAREALASSENR